jgi:branched-chain amino acid transport system permease protein
VGRRAAVGLRMLRVVAVVLLALITAALLVLIAFAPFVPMGGMRQYVLHVIIQIFIWSFIGGAWSLMGRFGLVSLGHGAFLGLGAYTTTLLWNFYGLTPWLGTLAAVALTVAVAVLVAYPCSRFRILGHYFALVTLAVGEVVRLLIIAERDWTGGSLGLTLKQVVGADTSLIAIQFADKRVFYYGVLVLWLAGLWVWARLDRSMARAAMEAIGEDETAAASVGIHVTRFKLGVAVLSAALTAIGGVAYAQYISYVNPDTLSGIGVSLRIVFAVVLGGMYSLLGPTVGTALTIALSEYLRVVFGVKFIGMAETIYGLLLILFIIFLPSGIYGSLRQLLRRRARPDLAPAA